MADWYVSSAAYAAIATFAISTAYTVGQIVKPIAPALKARWVFRVTTAGTSAASEPSWPLNDNATVTSGGAVFTNVSGQSAYGWTAAAGDIPTLLAGAGGTYRFAAGDRMFISSDHTETQTSTTDYGSGASAAGSYASGQVLSVNRAGSVPPVAADLLAGATVAVSGGSATLNLNAIFPVYHYGMNYTYTGSFLVSVVFNSTGAHSSYFDTCQIYINTATANRLQPGGPANIVLYNSTVRLGNVGQGFVNPGQNVLEITWLNTPTALGGGSAPTTLFLSMGSVIARGVDLSAVTGTLVQSSAVTFGTSKYLFDSCRIAPGVNRYNVSVSPPTQNRDIVELINCYDGTNIINESYQPAGVVTTERGITLAGGAVDDVGTFSHKMVSSTNIDKYVEPLLSFWMDIEQQAVGSSKTATVEIISSASLNNDEISLLLEYQGSAGSPVASFLSSLPVTKLTAAAALTTSAVTWNSSPATPVKQKLVVAFTPQLIGRVRGQVRLGKASTTVYVNPVIIIT